MSASGYNSLFNQTGPKSMLDYLQSRLAARDLSAEEALAMLGAVHEELNNPASADRGVYQRYSEFMESLRTEMPDVHDYVVSAWGQRGENKDKTEKDGEREYDDIEAGEHPGDVEAVKKSESGSPEDGDVSEKGDDEEGGEEGNELDKDVDDREEEADDAGEKEAEGSEAEEASDELEEESKKDEEKEGEEEAGNERRKRRRFRKRCGR